LPFFSSDTPDTVTCSSWPPHKQNAPTCTSDMKSDIYGQQMEYSRLRYHVIRQGFTKFSDLYNATTWKLYCEDEGSMSLWSLGNDLLDTASPPRRSISTITAVKTYQKVKYSGGGLLCYDTVRWLPDFQENRLSLSSGPNSTVSCLLNSCFGTALISFCM
jgi:hypothetical protein